MNYEMGGNILSKNVKEKYSGVTMNANMKVSEQCRIVASKGNQVLGVIRINITYKEKSLIVPLYKIIVRPHLILYSGLQAWSPYLRKDITMLEKIQMRATKLKKRDLRYEERLKECGLTTLETRRSLIIMAGMAVFYVAGYLIEERRRRPVITASPRGQCSK